MIKNLVSIVMPTYNSGRFIVESIKSIQSQTYTNWEIIIVDDCSTDNTKEHVLSFMKQDDRIKYYSLETNSGAAVARTTSMKLATGEYIAFCDSDDLWMPDKLEKQLAFMDANNVLFCATGYSIIDEDGKQFGRTFLPPKKTTYNRLLLDCPVGNSTIIYNAKKLGKFTVPNIRKRNDDALWLTMLKKEKYIWGMPDILTKYRVRQNSISSDKVSLIKYHWMLYRNIEKLSYLRSAFHICFWCFMKVFKIK